MTARPCTPLDAGYLAHIAFTTEAGPVALPMFYVRDGESVLFHGSRKARFMHTLAAGAPMCFTVTHVDGLVLARSAFHHSMNYRSVMAHGRAEALSGAEKDRGMALFTARVREGRSGGERPANAQEAKTTEVLRLPLFEVAAMLELIGLFLIAAAFRRELQPAGFALGFSSMLSFVVFARLQGDPNPLIARVAVADIAGPALLFVALVLYWLRGQGSLLRGQTGGLRLRPFIQPPNPGDVTWALFRTRSTVFSRRPRLPPRRKRAT